MELVSIIMPVKNAELFLTECLESIISQTFTNWELIAVDDHSSDNSRMILEGFVKKDKRIKVVSNPEKGIISSLKESLHHAKGKYITRMDADDLMPATRIELMAQAIHGTEKTVISGLVRYFSDQLISKGYQQYEKWLNEISLSGTHWQNIYRECVVASPNWMVTKENLLELGGFNEFNYPEDYHLVLRWYQQDYRIKAVPKVTLLWREHSQRTSRTSAHYSQKAFFQLKINAFMEMDLRSENLVLWGNNVKTRLTKSILQKNGIVIHEMNLDNFKVIEQLPNPQVLIGIYPSHKERIEIECYLESLGLRQGRDYWYL